MTLAHIYTGIFESTEVKDKFVWLVLQLKVEPGQPEIMMIQIVKTQVEGFHLNCMYGHNKNVSITVISLQ